jgi:hypothetical protein
MNRVFRAAMVGSLLSFSAWASGQQPASLPENVAADQIVKLVQQSRQQIGLAKLGRIRDARLTSQACKRADKDDDSETVLGGFVGEKVGTMSCLSYSTSDPSLQSAKLLEWATRKDEEQDRWTARRLAVGVCFRRTANHPEGRYWVFASKYLGAIRTFFYRFVWD